MSSRNISILVAREGQPVYFIDSLIFLFYFARCVEPSLVTTHRGWKEPRSKAKPILLLGFGEEDKSNQRVSGYNHVALRNPTPLMKDPSPGQTHRHGQTRSKHPLQLRDKKNAESSCMKVLKLHRNTRETVATDARRRLWTHSFGIKSSRISLPCATDANFLFQSSQN